MKRISAEELHGDFSLQQRSRAAQVTFGCGLIGVLLCLMVVTMTERFLTEVKSMVDKADEQRFEMTLDEQIRFKEDIDKKTLSFFRTAFPIFLITNALWIIGGIAWTKDLNRRPSNLFLRKIGGLLLLLTAIACGLGWFILFRLNQQAG